MPEGLIKIMFVMGPWPRIGPIEEWEEQVILEVSKETEHLRRALLLAETENERMFVGTYYATKFYEFLRPFCSAQSVRLVADHLRSLASKELEADGKQRDAAMRNDG